MKTHNLTIVLLVTVVSITSCTSFKPMATSSDYTTSLKKDDVIRVTPADGTKPIRFKIKQVSSDTLFGSANILASDGRWTYEYKTISTAEISTLKKREISKGKTIALTVVLVIISIPIITLLQLNYAN
ncbi:MAG: hypothetical protein U5K54_03105 [Cytophagales bacterium]|nr:hypothetical protein [Cytophagales bacterium]